MLGYAALSPFEGGHHHPYHSLALGQTMVGAMAVIMTSFERTYAMSLGFSGLLQPLPLTPWTLAYLAPSSGLLQKVPCTRCCTQCPLPCSRLPLTHTSARDSWTLMDKSRSVSCGVTAPFSWVLVCTRFCLCPPRVCFPVLCKFWQLYGRVNGDLLQKVPCTHCCTQGPQLCSRPPLTHASAGGSWTLTGESGSVSCGVAAPFSWVLVCTRFCLCPP